MLWSYKPKSKIWGRSDQWLLRYCNLKLAIYTVLKLIIIIMIISMMMKLGNAVVEPQVKLDRVGLVCKLGCSLTDTFYIQNLLFPANLTFNFLPWRHTQLLKQLVHCFLCLLRTCLENRAEIVSCRLCPWLGQLL